MDAIENDHTRREDRPPTADGPPIGAADLAVVLDALDVGKIPIVGVIGAILLFPFMLVALLRMVWPLLRWCAAELDYRRYLNGGTW